MKDASFFLHVPIAELKTTSQTESPLHHLSACEVVLPDTPPLTWEKRGSEQVTCMNCSLKEPSMTQVLPALNKISVGWCFILALYGNCFLVYIPTSLCDRNQIWI